MSGESKYNIGIGNINNKKVAGYFKLIVSQLSLRQLGKFILYANIPYLYPHPTNQPPNKLGGPWGIGGFGGGGICVVVVWWRWCAVDVPLPVWYKYIFFACDYMP